MPDRRLLAIAAMTTALGACSTMAPPAPAPAPVPAAPAPEDGLDWLFTEDGGEAALTYGTPYSDDLRLGFRCSRGAPRWELTQVAGEAAPPAITLQAGGVVQSFSARAQEEPMSGGTLLTARVRKDAPVLAAFREHGWVATVSNGAAEPHAPQPGTSAVADFFAWCG